jgi:hypothetical protein
MMLGSSYIIPVSKLNWAANTYLCTLHF